MELLAKFKLSSKSKGGASAEDGELVDEDEEDGQQDVGSSEYFWVLERKLMEDTTII